MATRREFLAAATAAAAGTSCAPNAFGVRSRGAGVLPRPSAAQLQWQRDELALFFHFGMNTFTNREWGDGRESPTLFAPTALDTDQWTESARLAGARAAILTAKHHDGFCLWPTATTRHSVASSPWRDGRGDVVREFVDSCHRSGIRPGLYLSPWDRNHSTYGTDHYNDIYTAQLTELLTRYGPIAEVWFDGANGEGPNGQRQHYDWKRIWSLVRRLQPDAIIFSDAGPDVRWCGNENGVAGDPNWSMVDPSVVRVPGMSGPEVTRELQHGDPAGTVWRPAEVDVSIRPGWFYHASEDDKVRDSANLVELYLTSIGRNGKLLLNVPPTPVGTLHPTDVDHLKEFAASREREFGYDASISAGWTWLPTGAGMDTLLARWDKAVSIGAVRIAEPIKGGQRVAGWRIDVHDGQTWRPLMNGTTIGYARIERITPIRIRAVRVRILKSLESSVQPEVALFR